MRLIIASAALVLAATPAFAQGTPAPGNPPGDTAAPVARPQTPASSAGLPAATINQTPQTSNSPRAPALQTNGLNSRTAAAPVPGRNSFTMGEARDRIASAGFSNVTGLKKDSHGIWRGQAQKNGASTPVALDYQGNVVAK